ncbi:activator of Hsp90 ATPase-like protein [Streptomyces sp. KS 21]|nr:activator of Hsp90 ATPase-like protein [Streptomyces sp. KS 21]
MLVGATHTTVDFSPSSAVIDRSLPPGSGARPPADRRDDLRRNLRVARGVAEVQPWSCMPQTYLAYRWASAFPGEELREDNSTLVEFTLTAEGDKTRLRVVESGFATLSGPEDLRAKAVKDNTGGWPQVLDALKKRTEQSSA